MESWKPIPGWPEYLVSDAGNVKSIFSNGICLKPDTSSHGYPRVTLYKGEHRKRKWKRFQVHQLVVITFIGPYPKDREVNHKNGLKTDARLGMQSIADRFNVCIATVSMIVNRKIWRHI